MKKILTFILVTALSVIIFGCGSKALYEPGTYTGGAPGIHGEDVVLEVTVDKKEIIEIKVIENNETPGVSDVAFERIPLAIINGQTLNVDTVSGATFSSKAIIGAATEALKKAGADIAELIEGAKTEADTVSAATEVLNADIVIIGAGGAGLAAAVSANQNGASVIVLEKMPQIGGNTIISGAAYNCADPEFQAKFGIEDSVEKHYEQTFNGGDKLGDPVLIQTLVENALPTLKWLDGMGMEFKDHIFTVLGGLWPRAHKPVKPLGTGFIETYMNYINAHDDIKIITDTKATEIYLEEGRASVVKATGPNGTVIAQGHKAVIIATGGFGNNIEMRQKYNKLWATLDESIKTTNHPGATGDGIVMAEKIGAALIGMEYIQLLPMGDPKTGSLLGNIEQGVENRIFVNKDGNRFVDEGERRDVMTKALFDQEDAYMWIVLDSHNYPTRETKNNFNESIQEMLDQGRAFEGNTIEELAGKIGVDSAKLKAAVDGFNAAVESGKPDSFGRTLFDQKIDTPPYYAGARMPTVHHTMGGIKINAKTQVIDSEGNVIPGLYAAGETTGGIHGANRLGGNALPDINVFGKIAGANAAAEQ
ncbi:MULTISPECIES: flavocytochrome c [unclassified Oceanispirochaeta]|uniref:flavocytochrome c n=1 Tax=unclassified Oceanispirochaeta TaxID=2635722 RepID=UPI000E09B814|nr:MULTISPECIES: flavocytochrome c [unclassified Oceanispirochaeta]MBF9016614.1 flavocytochrome c [Oceanispirochaeta sp. M2]NPD73181.1 flavocytochrome c [Oceanispirochaeta sp. M1]RDG31278.1 flavocytochrome c [Oceanispirochaeta sp. M1]